MNLSIVIIHCVLTAIIHNIHCDYKCRTASLLGSPAKLPDWFRHAALHLRMTHFILFFACFKWKIRFFSISAQTVLRNKSKIRKSRSYPGEDQWISCSVVAAIQKPPHDWKWPIGRPSHTWLRAFEADLKSLNIGLASARKKATIGRNVDTTMLKYVESVLTT